jgi:glyoxylase-like metal-dependent hydrolase (beta-lactamase superfamily II)
MHPPLEAAPGVWQIALSWSRAYILTDEHDFTLVDTGTCRDTRALLNAFSALDLDPARCGAVLLTHGHCDHAGNAALVAERFGARIHAHEAERPFLETSLRYGHHGRAALVFAAGEQYWPVRRHPVDVVLNDSDSVDTPAGRWSVIHTPGHTPGHVAFYREADGVLLSGDALLNIVPYRRTEGIALPQAIFTTDVAQARASARRIATLEPRVLLPGHGRPLRDDTAARIREFVAKLP